MNTGVEHKTKTASRIMVVEDEIIIAQDIKCILESYGYEVSALVTSGEEAVKKAIDDRPDMILMDIFLKGYMDGIEASGQIHSRCDIPVIYLTAYADDRILERAKLTEPYSYLIKPFEERELYTIVEMALYKHRMERKLKQSEQRFRNLVETTLDLVWEVDRESVFTYVSPQIKELLGLSEMTGTSFFESMAPDDAVQVLRTFSTHKRLPSFEHINRHKNGNQVFFETRAVPFFDGQGNFCGYRGISREITQRKQMEAKLRYKAIHDSLTGLFNREYFMDQLISEIAASCRYQYPLTLSLCDLDNFKQVNDNYGHLMGDQVLAAFAKIVNKELRSEDVAGRYGGDEFCFLFPHIDAKEAAASADRIRSRLKQMEFKAENGFRFSITVSFGIAEFYPVYYDENELLRVADQALYQAKLENRNRVKIKCPPGSLSGSEKR